MRRRRSSKAKKYIYAADWLKFKPYKKTSKYDQFYANLANAIYPLLKKETDRSFEPIEAQHIRLMSIHLAQYVEDFASEIGVWKAFIDMNEELYGYVLPFFDLSNYNRNDLNQVDIQFLLWYYFCSLAESTYLPYDERFQELSQEIFDLLEEYDELPVNDFYETYFKVELEDNYFDIKLQLFEFVTSNFLLGLPNTVFLSKQIEDMMNSDLEEHIDRGIILYYLQEVTAFKHRFRLNGLNGVELFAHVVRCSEETKQQLLKLDERPTGQFVFRGTEGDYYQFEHWTTGRQFKVWKESMSYEPHVMKKGTLAKMELVRWNDKWWQSGMLLGGGSEYDDKPNIMEADYSFYSNKEHIQQKIVAQTDLAHHIFVDTFGHFIYEAQSGEDLVNAQAMVLRKTIIANQKTADKKLTDEEIEENIQTSIKTFEHLAKEYERGTTFVSIEGEGTMYLLSYEDTIELLQKQNASIEDKEELYDCILVNYEPEVSAYLIENYSTDNLILPVPNAHLLDVPKYWKFLHRFESPGVYKKRVPLMKMRE
jgi:hypothetical protein